MIDDAFEWGAEVTESVCNFDDTQLSDRSDHETEHITLNVYSDSTLQ